MKNSKKGIEEEILDLLTKTITILSSLIITVFFFLLKIMLKIIFPSETSGWINKANEFITIFSIISGIVFFIILMLAAYKKLTSLLQSLQNIEPKIKELETTTLNILKKTVEVISDLADGKFIEIRDENIFERKQQQIGETLYSLGLNLKSWGSIISFAQNDETLIDVLLRCCSTYFKEEAFDIKRKELITNVRNYTFLLAQTLMAYLKNCKSDEKILFYAVTPIHPKDWYNWPHGRDKPRVHFEGDLMKFYRRLLQGIIKHNEYSKKVEIARVVLFVNDDNLRNSFNWSLSNHRYIEEQLSNWTILDIPIPFSSLENINKQLNSFYSQLFEQHNINEKDDIFIIPLYCEKLLNKKHYNIKPHEEWETTIKNIINNKLDQIKQQLKSQVETNYYEVKKILKKSKFAQDINIGSKYDDFYNKLSEELNNKTNSFPILDFIEFMQLLSVYYPEEHKSVDKYMLSVLRLLNSRDVNDRSTLNIWWANTLHSSPDKAKYYILDQTEIKSWKEKGISPSFVIFGKSKKNSRDEEEKRWQLVFLSDIPFPPLKACKIQFKDTNDEEFFKYIEVIENLATGSTSFT
jgi:hypothetical protein